MANNSIIMSEINGGPLETEPSLWSYMKDGVENHPDAIAVIVAHQSPVILADLLGTTPSHPGEYGSLTCTFKDLLAASMRLGSGLLKRGVKPGDTIAAFIPSGIEWIILFWASAILKTTLAMLDPESLSESENKLLQHFMNITKPSAILVNDGSETMAIDQAVLEILPASPTPLRITLSSNDVTKQKDWISFSQIMHVGGQDLVDEKALLEDALNDDPDRIAWILFTSGTTGALPKGCPRSIRSVVEFIALRPKPQNATRNRYNPGAANNFHISPVMVMPGLFRSGSATVIPGPTFDPISLMNAAEKFQITGLILSPWATSVIAMHPDYTPAKFQSVTMVMTGAEPISRTHYKTMCRVVAPATLFVPTHAQTEGSWLIPALPPNMAIERIPFVDGIYPTGKIRPGVRARVWDPETKTILQIGQKGELIVSGRGVISRYFGRIDADAGFHIDEQGTQWFRTGDSAVMHESGVVCLDGRISDYIRRGPTLINPRKIEISIREFAGGVNSDPFSQLVCVVAVPSEEFGQVPVAVVSSLESMNKSKDDVIHHVAGEFGQDYGLDKVLELKELGMDEWPYNSVGKLLRRKLIDAIGQL